MSAPCFEQGHVVRENLDDFPKDLAKQGEPPDYAMWRACSMELQRDMKYDNVFHWTLLIYLQEKQKKRAG